jgi:hypothetical protein
MIRRHVRRARHGATEGRQPERRPNAGSLAPVGTRQCDRCCAVIPSGYDQELEEALPRILLAPGEQLINVCTTYIANFASNGKNVTYQGSTKTELALTTINLRWFTWRTQQVKTGFLAHADHLIPEIGTESSIALSKITTVKSSQGPLAREVDKAFNRLFGFKVGPCTFFTVNWQGGFLEVFSPFDAFPVLVKNMGLALSGSALSSNTHSVAEAIERLAALKNEGVLTDEEFDRAKAGFVGSSVEQVESSASLLRQLHALRQGGVLTESEFNVKKWDILSHPH